MPDKIHKVVIPVAGYGTRFLPFTKAAPKEMLPIVDKPVIQYIVEEAVRAGFREVILITGSTKRAIEDHFDSNFELEYKLERAGKLEQLKEVRRISSLARFIYVRQPEPLGNGHAVLMAKEVVGDEPFALSWGDEIVKTEPPLLAQLEESFHRHNQSVLSLIQAPKSKFEEFCSKYGCADVEKIGPHEYKIKRVIEKPSPQEAPSDLFSIGGWVYKPKVMEVLSQLKPGKGGEIWLQDANDKLAREGELYGRQINCDYYDMGSKVGFLKATIDLALERPDVGPELRAHLKKIKF